MQWKFSSVLSSLTPMWRTPIVSSAIRNLTCQRSFPDPPCKPQHPKCHFVKDKCWTARNTLTLKVPFDKQMLDLERQKPETLTEPPCCVLRASSCTPCAYAWPKRKEKELDSLIRPFRSMWEHRSIPHKHPSCPDLYPRFDAMYYSPSNKSRCFQRTWVECPKVHERLKKICCPDKIIPPEVQRRVKEPCPQVACAFDYARNRKLCAQKSNYKCTKLFWPCCKPVRCELGCKRFGTPSTCKRLRAPYPCFSETRPRHRVRRQNECSEVFNLCQMFALQNRREIFNIKSSYC